MKFRFFKDLTVLMGISTFFLASAAAEMATTRKVRCEDLLAERQIGLKADEIYVTGDPFLKTVSFDKRALKEMNRLDDLMLERLLRSILKGFVPPVSGPGVVRLTDVHQHLVEVKVVKKSVTRLIGCFTGGHLHVRRVYHKRNEGKGSALQNFRDLCN